MFNDTAMKLGSNSSCIREIFEFGLRQKAIVGAENVYDYSLGNPSIPAPPEVADAIRDILATEDSIQVHGYTSAVGYDGVRKAVAEDLTERSGMTIRPENLFFTCGAAPALMAVLRALHIDEETEIVAIAPFFPEYRPFTQSSGSRLVVVEADTKAFQIDLDGVEKAITNHTQAVIINSPNNPSGVVYTAETLKKLAAILTKKSQEIGHPIYIISDEPYRELVYGGVEVPFIPAIYPNTVICYSYSKSLSLPGERIGYVCVPDCAEQSAELFTCVKGAARMDAHTCAPSLIQRVIARCAKLRPDLRSYDENRTLLYEALTSYGYECAKPDGAFYLFVKAPGGDAKAFSERAKKENLLVVPSDDFGVKGYFRLSYCVSNDMIRRSLPAFQKLIETK